MLSLLTTRARLILCVASLSAALPIVMHAQATPKRSIYVVARTSAGGELGARGYVGSLVALLT